MLIFIMEIVPIAERFSRKSPNKKRSVYCRTFLYAKRCKMERNIFCDICGRKLMKYDGKAKIPQIVDCKKCKKRVVYDPLTNKQKVKMIPKRNSSSGVVFH